MIPGEVGLRRLGRFRASIMASRGASSAACRDPLVEQALHHASQLVERADPADTRNSLPI
jgi:hypothetical protein